MTTVLRARRVRVIGAAAVFLTAVGAGVALTADTHPPLRDAARCLHAQAATVRMTPPFDGGATRVDILGDSYSVGATLHDPRVQSWPALLARSEGWQVRVHGVSGTGFVNGGPCRDGRYATRVAQVLADRPDLVIVEGGLNDLGDASDLSAAADAVLARFPRSVRVVVVGPAAAPAFRRTDEDIVDGVLRSASAAAHRQYVSTLSWPLTFSADRIHPDAGGAEVFAERLADALTA